MPHLKQASTEVGEPIPCNVPHAISVTLPTWAANVGYEEGADWVVSKMQCGYPRFFIGKNIQRLAERCVQRFGVVGESGMLFPTARCADQCRQFIISKTDAARKPPRIVEVRDISASVVDDVGALLCVVLFDKSLAGIAKQFWQHTGEGISSRLADYFLRISDHSPSTASPDPGSDSHVEFTKKNQNHNRHYSRKPSVEKVYQTNRPTPAAGDAETLNRDQLIYLEERYGRNLELKHVKQAKVALKRRIAGSLALDADIEEALRASQNGSKVATEHERVHEDDVYLYPCGMNAIFHAHQLAMSCMENGTARRSACFGFPYTDTLKILEKWGPGAVFYGRGDDHDLKELENLLASGEKLLALFCECPSNPLLRTPPLKRLRQLADQYGFLLIIDETIGNFINIRICQYADIIVSSLTKVFSGDSNVMGGGFILNPKAPFYSVLKSALEATYEDNLWTEDAITLERNSRDYVSRIARINQNAEAVCDLLVDNKLIKALYYPKYGETKHNYEAIRAENGGYGGLFSVVFEDTKEAAVFFDALNTAKGPSLGTNFTLASPYTVLAHFTELPWAAEFGVSDALVRVSVGLEDEPQLLAIFNAALDALADYKK
ncbi:hypothetical protein MRB53_039083 [Persea americana]|nr:hypothetical protein MRB53_039083 [Persea americana]